MAKPMAYNGSHAVVDVPGAGLYGIERGESVEIEDSRIRGRLRRQGWTYAHGEDETDDTNSDTNNTDNEQEGDDE